LGRDTILLRVRGGFRAYLGWGGVDGRLDGGRAGGGGGWRGVCG